MYDRNFKFDADTKEYFDGSFTNAGEEFVTFGDDDMTEVIMEIE